MKKSTLAIVSLFLGVMAHSQTGNVGINTSTPQTTLDVVGQPSDATKLDGLTAPRLTGDQLKAKTYTSAQIGTLVYATAGATSPSGQVVNVTSPGYYYFDGNVWISTGGGNSANYWNIAGNSGTIAGTHFLGTTDNQDLIFKRGNVSAGWLSDTSSGNTSLGTNSFPNTNGAGIHNTAIGTYALSGNKSAENVGVGYNSLGALTTGLGGAGQNTAVGTNALARSNGFSNTGVGYQAGLTNSGISTGSFNTYLGNNAGYNVQGAGSNNTYIGSGSGSGGGSSALTGSGNTAIGNNAAIPVFTGSNQLSIANAIFGLGLTGTVAAPAGNIGIGTSAPGNTLEVKSATAGTSGLRLTNLVNAAVLSTNASGDLVAASSDPANGLYWGLSGNSGTTPGTNFIGTTDNNDVVFKRNNVQAGWLNASFFSTALGVNSLPVTSTGNNNTAAGYGALKSNTTGNNNAALGYNALNANTTGSLNTAFGSLALSNNVGGGGNGSGNSAFGASALQGNTSGYFNSAFGYRSLIGNTTGANNDAFGNTALFANTTGQFNTAFGSATLSRVTTGSYNSGMAGGGYGVVAGSNNVSIGYNNMSATGGDYSTNTSIGVGALNKVVGNDNAVVGYNIMAGLSSGLNNMPGNGNAALGSGAFPSINSMAGFSNNVAIGYNAGSVLVSGNNNIAIGANTAFSTASANGQLNIGNSIYGVNINSGSSNAQIGINGATDGNTLAVNGTASKAGGGLWATYSDYRVKKDIASFKDGLSVIKQLKPVTYRYNEKSGYTDLNKQYIGFIAQEVEKAAPYMVGTVDDSKVSGLKDKRTLDESALTKILVNAIQEQQTEIEQLKAEIQELKMLIKEYKK